MNSIAKVESLLQLDFQDQCQVPLHFISFSATVWSVCEFVICFRGDYSSSYKGGKAKSIEKVKWKKTEAAVKHLAYDNVWVKWWANYEFTPSLFAFLLPAFIIFVPCSFLFFIPFEWLLLFLSFDLRCYTKKFIKVNSPFRAIIFLRFFFPGKSEWVLFFFFL